MRTYRKAHAPGARVVWLAAAAAAAGCTVKQNQDQHFYDQHIQPILNTFCVGNTSPCHKVDPGTQTALGNLDLTSFEGVQKRRDVLRTYGSYPQPLLLLKALPDGVGPDPLPGDAGPERDPPRGRQADRPNSDAYYELKRWLDNGANRDGVAPAPVPRQGIGACNSGLPPASQRIPVDTTTERLRRPSSPTIEPSS